MEPDAYTTMHETESIHWWFKGRRNIIKSVLTKLPLPTSPKILEVGCGTGGNLELLRTFGSVCAIEMDTLALRLARSKSSSDIEIWPGNLPDNLPEISQKFDLICLFDVLEHIEQETESLKRLQSLLKPHGYVIFTVPAYSWLWGPHDEKLHHKRRYTRTSLQNSLHSTGFVIQRISYFNSLLFPLVALFRLQERLRPNRKINGLAPPPVAINSTFEKIFSSERHLLRHIDLPIGVSLLAIARLPTLKNDRTPLSPPQR